MEFPSGRKRTVDEASSQCESRITKSRLEDTISSDYVLFEAARCNEEFEELERAKEDTLQESRLLSQIAELSRQLAEVRRRKAKRYRSIQRRMHGKRGGEDQGTGKPCQGVPLLAQSVSVGEMSTLIPFIFVW